MTPRESISESPSPSFSELDRQFAALMERLAGGNRPELWLAAALVSWRHREGDVCLDLATVADTDVAEETGGRWRAPPLPAWSAALRTAATVVGGPGDVKPLILDRRQRLYLRRYWWYEEQVAEALMKTGPPERSWSPDPQRLRSALTKLFPGSRDEIHWQRIAAFAAVRHRVCVISGGPGTGKTTTVVRILALLAELASPQDLRFAIAAPTGKAAARLQESIQAQKAGLVAQFPAAAGLPDEVKTIHRLLGSIPGSPAFRHDAANPLPVDVVVVDEASMVALALMAKLLRAVPPTARVILLGDQDQLASVEAGNVLGDISANPEPNCFSAQFSQDYRTVGGAGPPVRTGPPVPLADCLVRLRQNFRFGANSGIHRASEAVNRGDGAAALAVLRDEPGANDGSIVGRRLPDRAGLKAALRDRVCRGFGEPLRAPAIAPALTALGRFRLLAAAREGPFGVIALNALAEEILREEGLIGRPEEWYHGRQVLVTANDYSVNLFNGDLGLVWHDADDTPGVWFPEAGGGARRIAPSRLPAHETAFALTVHKSQGSEFAEVLLILPERMQRVLTRELLYTGLTRARELTEVWFQEPVFREAISRRTERASGLRERLWGG